MRWLTALIIIASLNGFVLTAHAQKKQTNAQPKAFACLPSDVQADEVVEYGVNGKRNITVSEKLRQLRATCRRGRLLGRDGKQIRFFRFQCWGNPPPDYLEIQAEQSRQLKKLKLRYTVITINCDPRIP
jgi:hypothetical protein